MTETCYKCDKPATYVCDAKGCGHRMCQDHAVLVMLEDSKPEQHEDIEAGASYTDALDHAHFCLDHAPSIHI